MAGFRKLIDRAGKEFRRGGPAAVIRYAGHWLRLHRPYHVTYDPQALAAQRAHRFPEKHTISILVPLYNTPLTFLREMIDSVAEQTYGGWELCLADGSDDAHAEVGAYCLERAAADPRIVYRKLEQNIGIAGNTNACIGLSSGDYIALFDHDDLLVPSALYEVMCAICEQGADYVYTDEATFVSPDRNAIAHVHFKPDFAPDNLRANNYICHLSVFARTVLDAAGPFSSAYDGSQDHELIMRLTDHARRIVHIPKVLYLWRSHPNSTASDISAKTYAIDAGQRAVRDQIACHGMSAEVASSRAFPTIYRIRYAIPEKRRVSILLAGTGDLSTMQRCAASILEKTAWPDYELILETGNAADPAAAAWFDRMQQAHPERFIVCRTEGPTDIAHLHNAGARLASGDHLLLLDSSLQVVSPCWIEEMMMYAQREDVAAVGAMLHAPNRSVAHAGMILGLGPDRLIGFPFRQDDPTDIGYMGRLCYAQNLSAVSGDCMLVKASVWQDLGGLDEQLTCAYGDADFCLRARKAGYLICWTPYAELCYQRPYPRRRTAEAQARVQTDADLFRTRWSKLLAQGDPYYNPNFSLDHSDFSFK